MAGTWRFMVQNAARRCGGRTRGLPSAHLSRQAPQFTESERLLNTAAIGSRTNRRIRTFEAGEFSQRADAPIAQFCSLVAGLSIARRVP